MIRPPFRNFRQAALYLALLCFVVGLPGLVWLFHIPTRAPALLADPDEDGAYRYAKRLTYDEQGDLDIVFTGSSLIWVGIDAPYVQDELSRKLGHPAKVADISFGSPGQDMSLVLMKDLFAHRHVKMLVTYMPIDRHTSDEPHLLLSRIVEPMTDFELMLDASWPNRALIYAFTMGAMPKRLVSLLRSEEDSSSRWDETLGSRAVNNGNPLFRPPVPTVDPKSLIYSPETERQFDFSGQELNSYQMGVARRLIELCRSHGTHLVLLNVPVIKHWQKTRVQERMNWPEIFGKDVDLVGIPPARLFAGLHDQDVLKMYYNDHLDYNGRYFFTRAITPALLELYGRKAPNYL